MKYKSCKFCGYTGEEDTIVLNSYILKNGEEIFLCNFCFLRTKTKDDKFRGILNQTLGDGN